MTTDDKINEMVALLKQLLTSLNEIRTTMVIHGGAIRDVQHKILTNQTKLLELETLIRSTKSDLSLVFNAFKLEINDLRNEIDELKKNNMIN